MALFNTDSYQKSVSDWPNSSCLKYDNHPGGGQSNVLTQDHRLRCAMETIACDRWTTRPDEITESDTNKGYNRTLKYSNGLNYSSLTIQLHKVF